MKKNDLLKTPAYIYKALGPFDLDPCAGENTNIGAVNYAIERGEDGLTIKWDGLVFCNPPFSVKEKWIEKMIDHGKGILLLPERGCSPWFGPLAGATGRHFVMGKKIDFEGGASSNPTGTCLFPFGVQAYRRLLKCGLPGHMNRVEWVTPRKKEAI